MEENCLSTRLKVMKIRSFLKPEIRYNQNFLPRPFVVEIAGPPSGGKTTIIRNLASFFRRNDFRVYRPLEAPEAIRHIDRDTPQYNIRTGLYSLLILLDSAFSHQYDLILLERGIFDPFYWMERWQEKEYLSEEQTKSIQNFFLLDFFTDKIDLAIFIICDPEVAYRREVYARGEGLIGPHATVAKLHKHNARYKNIYDRLSPKYPQLKMLDLTPFSEKEAEEQVRGIVISVLEKCVKERSQDLPNFKPPIISEGI